jgi:hypothetical protein
LPPKTLWRNLKNAGIKDEPYSETIFTAEELSSYYASLGSQTAQNLQNPAPNYYSTACNESFCFRNVDDLEVKNAVSGIKSMAIGLDGISLKFIVRILPLILACITHIFNTILTKSLFPGTLKKVILCNT